MKVTKTDKILEHVSNIRVKVGKIEQHLKNLNGTVDRHEEDISALKKMVYKLIGGAAVVIVAIQIITRYV